MIKKVLFMAIAVLMMSPFVYAKEIGGVNLPDTLKAGADSLILNGAGLRTKLFVKVYAAGLYLKQAGSDEQKIIDAQEPMAIRMHFIHDSVSGEKLVGAWNEGFENGTGGNTAAIKAEIDQFNSFFKADAKKGDIYDIIYTPDLGVRLYIKDNLMGTIKGLEFKKALFSIWLGKKPADSSLKNGMLNKN